MVRLQKKGLREASNVNQRKDGTNKFVPVSQDYFPFHRKQ